MAEIRTIGGYELIEKVGQGGMGSVFKARQPVMDRIVAVKILPREIALKPQFAERFMREARASARLNHPNIINGIDVGQENGQYYFAMEFVQGATLKEMLKQGRFSEDDAIKYIRPIAHALAHAHANGILHRDIKPENVLIDENDTPKLCDLGLARMESESEDEKGLTRSGQAVGTPHYIAPEQARGDLNIDARADLYSLGASLYQMLTGVTMFQGATAISIMSQHINEKAPHPGDLGVVLSKGMLAALSKLLAKDRSDRYASAQKLVEDLDRLKEGLAPQHADLPKSKPPFLPQSVNSKKSAPAIRVSSPRASVRKAAPESAGSASPGQEKPRAPRKFSKIADQQNMLLIGAALAAAVVLVAVLVLASGSNTKAPKVTEHRNSNKPDAGLRPVPESSVRQTTPKTNEAPVMREPKMPLGSFGILRPDAEGPAVPGVVAPAPAKADAPEAKANPDPAKQPEAPAAFDMDMPALQAAAVEMGGDARFQEAADLFKTAREKGGFKGLDLERVATRAEAYAALAEMKKQLLETINANPEKWDAGMINLGGKRGVGKFVGGDDKGLLIGDAKFSMRVPWQKVSFDDFPVLARALLNPLPAKTTAALAVLALDQNADDVAGKILAELDSADPLAKAPLAELASRPKPVVAEKPADAKPVPEKAVIEIKAPEPVLEPGLWGEYYSLSLDVDSIGVIPGGKKLALSRVDSSIDFGLSKRDFAGTGLKERFYARWSGVLRVPKKGRYKFTTDSGDGSRLYIGRQMVVDNDRSRVKMREASGLADLEAGDVEIGLELFCNNEPGCKLYWESESQPKQIIPESVLFHKRPAGARQ
jgi:serine/threonine-protein kinase